MEFIIEMVKCDNILYTPRNLYYGMYNNGYGIYLTCFIQIKGTIERSSKLISMKNT